MPYIGMDGYLGIAQEPIYGQRTVPPVAFCDLNSEGIDLDSGLIIPRTISGKRGNTRVMAGPIAGNGPVNFNMTPEDCMGWFLKGVLGLPVTTTLAPGIYQHVFTPQAGIQLPSFTTQVNFGGGAVNWLGSRFSALAAKITPATLIEVVMTLMAQTVEETPPVVPSVSTYDPWTAFDATIEFDDVEITTFEDFGFNIDNGMDIVRTINNERFAGNVISTTFKSTGDFTLAHESLEYQKRLWGSVSATKPLKCLTDVKLELNIVKQCPEGEVVPGSGIYQTINFVWPSAYISGAKVNLTGADARLIDACSFETRIDPALGYQVQVTLINSQSGYPDP